MSGEHQHQAGALSQQNKRHKGRHASSRQLKRARAGRVERVARPSSVAADGALIVKRIERPAIRAQRLRTQRGARRKALAEEARARKAWRRDGPPALVVFVSLVADEASARTALGAWLSVLHQDLGDSDTNGNHGDVHGSVTVRVAAARHDTALPERVTFLTVDRLDGPDFTLRSLDACKVADIVVLVTSGSTSEVTEDPEIIQFLSGFRAQGPPAVAVVSLPTDDTMNAESNARSAHRRARERRASDEDLIRLLERYSVVDPGSVPKVHALSDTPTIRNTIRLVMGHKHKQPTWRRRNAYMLAQRCEWNAAEAGAAKIAVNISGYLRGRGLSANQLIHITDVGTFPLVKILEVTDPCPPRDVLRRHRAGDTMEEERVVGIRREEDAEPVESAAEPDPTAPAEQTWPPEDDEGYFEGAATIAAPTVSRGSHSWRRRPKGWSEYQCAWIAEDQSDEDELDNRTGIVQEVNMGDRADMGDGSDGASFYSDNEIEAAMQSEAAEVTRGGADEHSYEEDIDAMEAEPSTIGGNEMNPSEAQEEIDEDEVRRLREKFRAEEQFPDEVEAPLDIPARDRFARYRGLKSLRTSPWDPKEQLPPEYSRIFQFQNFRALRKRVLLRQLVAEREDPCLARQGSYVTLIVCGLTDRDAEIILQRSKSGFPLVLSSLNKYENRRTVIHARLSRSKDSSGEDGEEVVLRSKELLTLQCGFVRIQARPLFSEDNANCSKHKMERFFLSGRSVVATMYGPALFHPASVLAFREGRLVASGSLLPPDPDRIILKRIVLTGYPFKVHKRKAVIRFMFFDPDDIRYFKPVELWTKLGRTGHIIAPLGTHGYMKCIFDARLLSHDTVCMSLYKRCFPKPVSA